MKVAKLYRFNDIRIEDVSVPEIGQEDALIKTKACGICSGDVMKWYIEKKAPLVLGHEPAGEIVELGSSLVHHSSFSIGERVFVHHHAPCMTCRYCRRGDHVQCETWKKTKIIPGGISEYILIPEINLKNDTLKLPVSLSYEDGTLVEPTACVLKGLKRAGAGCTKEFISKTPFLSFPDLIGESRKTLDARLRTSGMTYKDVTCDSANDHISKNMPLSNRTALIIGLGVMGLINLLILKRLGLGKIIGADRVQYRLNKAMEFGADDVIDVSKENIIDALKEITDNQMADLVIVGPNSVEAMKEGISCAGSGGTVLFFTPAKPDEKLIIDPNYLYFRDIKIVTSYSCGPVETREALSLIEEGVVRAERLVTHRFPIEKTAEAFRLVAEAKESLKVVIMF
ncbi:MAG: alcohol dehydrogenase catalytic domain-containing protein [Thermodesulfovibrionales bacterium]